MRVRRNYSGALEVFEQGEWGSLDEATAVIREELAWLAPLKPISERGKLLPFQPKSFRDCTLFEKHWIQSSRGYARRFLPGAYKITSWYEKLIGKPFPAFKPHKLAYQEPIYYFGNHMNFVTTGSEVKFPSYSRALDYELELGVVLKGSLFNTSPQESLAAIGGLVVINDWSARDVQREEMRSGFGPQKSKHFLSAMSHEMVTYDDRSTSIDDLTGRVKINGNVVAETNTQGMMHSIGEVLSHLSKDEHLHPGELIATGTLPNGTAMENGNWVKVGDEIQLEIDGVGQLVQKIV